MLRWQTAGESHGEALVALIEGMPSGVAVSRECIEDVLKRRRLGYGRGARMKFEQDKIRLLTGIRHGYTLGSPIAVEIANTECSFEPSASRTCGFDGYAQIRF